MPKQEETSSWKVIWKVTKEAIIQNLLWTMAGIGVGIILFSIAQVII